MSAKDTKPLVIGRYMLLDELASGGMATVYIGRLVGPAGFSRTVAIKRLHPHLARDPEFVAMLLDEARLAGRIQHPNVAATLDVVAQDGELFVVMEYLHGETLSRLLRTLRGRDEHMPPDIASAILSNALHGLHAAHEVRGERGEPLGLVHRDISPQNIMVRQDGVGLVLDFGVAKAAGRINETEHGKVKGKLPYMAPEQVRGQALSRRTDIYAAGAVLWETLVGERLIRGSNEGEIIEQLLFATFEAPSARVDGLPPALDQVVQRALSRPVDGRFATAREMALALEEAVRPALPSRVADWLERVVGPQLEARASRLAEIETSDHDRLARSGELRELLERSSGTQDAQDSQRRSAPDVARTSSPVVSGASLQNTAAATPESEPASSTHVSIVSGLGSPALPEPGPAAAPASPSRRWLLGALAMVVVGGGAFAVGARRPDTSSQQPPAASTGVSSASPATSAVTAPASAPALASVAPAGSVEPPASASAAPSAGKPAAVKKGLNCSDVRQRLPSGRIVYRRECL